VERPFATSFVVIHHKTVVAMKFLGFLFLLGGCWAMARAQNVPPLPQTSLRAAYLGSLKYPGLVVGIERPYKVVQVTKPKRHFLKERHWVASVGFYHHTRFHSNFFMLVEHQSRRQSAKGWFVESAAGAGFSRTFLAGTTYRVAGDGTVSTKKMAGYPYALVSLGFGGGYNFAVQKGKPFRLYSKMGLLTLLPYNNFLYMRPMIQLGITYTVPHFLSSKPSIKIKKK
jgi:hypothetical protein